MAGHKDTVRPADLPGGVLKFYACRRCGFVATTYTAHDVSIVGYSLDDPEIPELQCQWCEETDWEQVGKINV